MRRVFGLGFRGLGFRATARVTMTIRAGCYKRIELLYGLRLR